MFNAFSGVNDAHMQLISSDPLEYLQTNDNLSKLPIVLYSILEEIEEHKVEHFPVWH